MLLVYNHIIFKNLNDLTVLFTLAMMMKVKITNYISSDNFNPYHDLSLTLTTNLNHSAVTPSNVIIVTVMKS